MKTHKSNLIAVFLMIVYLAAVAYCCFGVFNSIPNVQRSYFGIPTDKIVHFLMFFPYPFLCFMMIDNHKNGLWHRLLLVLASFLSGCMIAASTEIGQSFTTYRSGDIRDYYADILALGIASFITLIAAMLKPEKDKKGKKKKSR